MHDFSKCEVISRTPSAVTYVLDTEPDILVSVPAAGTKDTVHSARDHAGVYYGYATATGKPCGLVVIMNNLLSQEPEARRIYQNIDKTKIFAAALVVESPLARALGSFFVGLTRPVAPTRLFSNMDGAIEWLKAVRPAAAED